MGCAASVRGGYRIQDEVTTFEDDDLSSNSTVDFELGFSHRACHYFAISDKGTPKAVRDLAIAAVERQESDEFRVLRVSSLSGQVTLYVAGGKHKKPVQYQMHRDCPRANEQPVLCSKCPFCPGNEAKTPPNVLAINDNGEVYEAHPSLPSRDMPHWQLRVFPNVFPMLIVPPEVYGPAHNEALRHIPHSAVARGLHSNDKVSFNESSDALYTQVDALGLSEVFVESPVHNALLALQDQSKIDLLLQALVLRGRAMSKEPFAKQILIFKQYGPLSGGSLVHPHTQMTTLPTVPPVLQSRLEFGLNMYKDHGRCAVCSSLVDPFVNNENRLARSPSGEPVVSRMVHVTDHFTVSVPYSSSSQYSMTVAPRRHCASFFDITEEERKDLASVLSLLSQVVFHGLDDPSYNIFFRTAPCKSSVMLYGRKVSQEDIAKSFHWIIEFRPRFPADVGGFEIASGIRVVGGLPEDHAAELRTWVQERLQLGAPPVKSTDPWPAGTAVRHTGNKRASR